ncbi:MAG: hypothetical protein ACRDFQ_09230 [Anaerolineales bacterium]
MWEIGGVYNPTIIYSQLMTNYDRDFYSRRFARLINKALEKGKGDPMKALYWLEKRYNPLLALLFSRHRVELADAYLDAREHILKRIEGAADEE